MVSLASCQLFHALAPPERQGLEQATRELTFAAGQEIFREGDRGDGIYLVQSGRVQISAVVGEGQRQVFSQVAPGEVFGELAVLDNQPRSATATAEVETLVYFVPRDPLLAAIQVSPEFSLSLMQEISQRLREFNREYIRTVLQVERMALVGRFASSIVHDLKNPLTIIGVAADLACLETTTPEARKTAQGRIRRQVDRISHMVSDILDFTRGTTAPPVLAMMDYGGFVSSIVEEIAREIVLKGVQVEIPAIPEIKLAINPQRLSRVFYNLMMNAVDAMPEGGQIKLHFRLEPDAIATEFEDTGEGIAPQMLPQLFQAFATFGKLRGTGLGLSISKKIVEEHGGQIYARNLPGAGALFGFTLPRPSANAG